jgi:hypothetical protein
MIFLRNAALGAIALMATAGLSAQQKFPLHSGEWETTTPSSIANQPPTVLRYCLNDELWTKALTKLTSCSVTDLAVTPIGASYDLDCPMKTVQMKGKVVMRFDGMSHMTAKGSFDMTMNGKVSHSESQTDYRWKGPTCNPNTDMNLKFNHAH